MTTAFKVPDASCGHCKSTIETAVSGLAGVSSAELDLESNRLTVQHDAAVEVGHLKAAIEGVGYSPELVS